MNHHFSKELRMRGDSRACRWLAGIAWMFSFGWFWLVTIAGIGFTPSALLAWTLLALALAWLVVRSLNQSGREPGHRLIGVGGFTWMLLCAGAILIGYYADNPFWDGVELQVFLLAYALFPLIVTCMAIVHAWRRSRQPRVLE
jgi:hypothetical protein